MSKAKINTGAIFERFEKKYVLTIAQYLALKERMNMHMQVDMYGKHTICSLYYDTKDYAVIRRCLEKPKYKEKLRMRSYGVPGQADMVYLELKKKLAGITYKRRVAMPLREATVFMQHGIIKIPQTQITKEIDWYKKMHELQESVLICYDRIALFGKEDRALRITFDENIRWRNHHLALDKGDYGEMLLPDMRLMEVKTMNALPRWLCKMLTELKIYPTSFSKYGTIYAKHLSEKQEVTYYVG